jgi:hypothetical protein
MHSSYVKTKDAATSCMNPDFAQTWTTVPDVMNQSNLLSRVQIIGEMNSGSRKIGCLLTLQTLVVKICTARFDIKQDVQCTYNVTLRRLRITTVAVEKQ